MEYRNAVNLYTNTVVDGCVILFVRYRNNFPVVQFQNQAHIRNPHETGQIVFILFLSPPPQIWGTEGPQFFILFFYRH